MDDELLNQIASLERKALQASHQQAQHAQQAQQQAQPQFGQPFPPAAGFQQQQAQQTAMPPPLQQEAPQTSVPAPLAGQSLPRVPPSTDGAHCELARWRALFCCGCCLPQV